MRTLALLLPFFAAATPAPTGFRQPPDPIPAMLDARRPPGVEMLQGSTWMVLMEKWPLPALSHLAAPEVALAGVRIDPLTGGPAEPGRYQGVSLRRTADKGDETPIVLPPDREITGFMASRDQRQLGIYAIGPKGYELWVADVADDPRPRLLIDNLHMAGIRACAWLAPGEGLVCKTRLPGAPPAPPLLPPGPRIEENLGEKRPARTQPDLLRTNHDQALFGHYLRAQLVKVSPTGDQTPLDTGVFAAIQPSPDGQWLLTQRLVGETWPTTVTWGSFARLATVRALKTGQTVEVGRLEVADRVPTAFDAVRPGPRVISWRADAPATLLRVSALDGGDPKVEAPHRDLLELWPAPFSAPPAPWMRLETRFGAVVWGDGDLALVEETRWTDRQVRLWALSPDRPAKAPHTMWTRSEQDAYGDPGWPLTVPNAYGVDVLQRAADGAMFFVGQGSTEAGDRPFISKVSLRDGGVKTTRLWTAGLDRYEEPTSVLDDEGKHFITWRESPTEPPNLFVHKGKKETPLTQFSDWAPQMAGVRQEIVSSTRADGMPLSATVYYPPGYDPKRDGPRPAVFWVYPNEFRHRSDAAQVVATANTFSRPSGTSPLFFLMRGFVVVDDPTLPIIGEGEAQPNDTYVEQLVSSATAHIDALASRGIIDRTRLVVGGHSYGAFTTANLLAHTDLFRAGIARSGAYNRTLTPFGFQGEERIFWEAEQTYVGMSPFSVANRINEPLLLIHGADDKNPGTWPMQSQRLYDALKGLGATVRFVELPYEDHGYRSRENVGHALAEMIDWAERYTAPVK